MKPGTFSFTFPIFLGLVVAIIGLVSLISWHLDVTTIALDSHYAGYIPMRYNTIICFLVTGIALVLTVLLQRRLASTLSLLVLIFSGLHLVEYIADIDLGMAQLFLRDQSNSAILHDNRLSLDTSVCFIFLSIALQLKNQQTTSNLKVLVVVLSTSLVLFYAFLFVTLDYGAGLISFYKIDNDYMALSTAFTLILLSAGILIIEWIKCQTEKEVFRDLIPYLAGIIIFTCVLKLTLYVNLGFQKSSNERLESIGHDMQNRILDRVQFYSEVTFYMSQRWESFGLIPEKIWYDDARFHVGHCIGMQAIFWLDHEFSPVWFMSHDNHMDIQSLRDMFHKRWPEDFINSYNTKNQAFVLSDDGRFVGVLFAAHSNNKVVGYTLAIIDFNSTINALLKKHPYPGTIEIFAGNKRVYSRMEESGRAGKEMSIVVKKYFHEIPWVMKLTLGERFLSDSLNGILTWLIFGFGSLLAVFSVFLLKQMDGARSYRNELKTTIEGQTYLIDRLDTLSKTDMLTGLFNRREILERLESEQLRFKRYQKPFSIILGDIDYFKKINDTYGHDAGDTVLKTIASILKNHSRATDSVSRWGGEEFLILLPETDLEGATKLAENVRVVIKSTPIVYEGSTLNLSMSFGVSCIENLAVNEGDIIRVADEHLYQAKASGRNIVIAKPKA